MDEKDFEVLSDLAKTCNISKTSQRLQASNEFFLRILTQDFTFLCLALHGEDIIPKPFHDVTFKGRFYRSITS